jgi:hypothetical protein
VSERSVLAIVDDERLLGNRYPEAVGWASTRVDVRPGRVVDLSDSDVLGGIVDSVRADEILAALRSGKPLLLGPQSLATVIREAPEEEPAATLLERDWIPFLPAGLSAEVASAAEILKGGALGAVRSCHLTTYFGPSAAEGWEQDSTFAHSLFEAIVFGLDLLANLFAASANSTRWLTNDATTDFGVAVHEFGGGIVATQEVVPNRLAAAPLFTAAVNCEEGRVLLRDEFAPGSLAVWEASSRSFRCPSFPREKPNVQAPDTVRGGLEAFTLIAALTSGERSRLPVRKHALGIVRHAIASGFADPGRKDSRGRD